ncbi:hypothetical protein EDD86DRAFT_268560 [Gorgonomyces haynaldii]|nr:hypothetical protein EDD86DRAFT_268560 [Gorgonomyces haynaldii]
MSEQQNLGVLSTMVSKQTLSFCHAQQKNALLASTLNLNDKTKKFHSVDSLTQFSEKLRYDEPDVEVSDGAVMVLRLNGYVQLVEIVAQTGTVEASVVAGSLESYISKVLEIIQQHSGDIISCHMETIVAVWRSKQSIQSGSETPNSGVPQRENVDRFVEPCLLAIAVSERLQQHFNDEFLWKLVVDDLQIANLPRLQLDITIGAGTLYDGNFGTPGAAMYQLILGNTFTHTFDAKIQADSNHRGIAFETESWHRVGHKLADYGITVAFEDQGYVTLGPTPAFKPELIKKAMDEILYAEMPEPLSKFGHIRPYLNDGHLLYFRDAVNKDIPTYITRGKWTHTAIITTFIKTNHTNVASKLAAINCCRDLYRYILKVTKSCNSTKKTFINFVSLHGTGVFKIVCNSDTAISPTKDPEATMIRMALRLRSSLEKDEAPETKFTYLVTAETCYEGMLMTKSRSFFRHISGERKKLLPKANQTVLSPFPDYAHEKPWGDIIAGRIVFSACEITNLAGYFVKDESDNLESHHVCPWEDVCRWKKVASEFNGIQQALQTIKNGVKSEGSNKIIVVHGIQGSGKTYCIKKALEDLKRKDFTTFVSEARQNSIFEHPLYSLSGLLFQMLQYLDSMVLSKTRRSSNVDTKKGLSIAPSGLTSVRESRIAPDLEMKDQKGVKSAQNFIKKFILSRRQSKVSPEPLPRIVASTYVPKHKDWKRIEMYVDVLESMGENVSEVLPLLNPLIEPEPEENSYSQSLALGGRTIALSKFFCRLINRLREATDVAIVIDNVHWLDSASWSIINYVVRNCSQTLFILSMSPTVDWPARAADELLKLSFVEKVEIQAWKRKEIDNYMLDAFLTYCHRVHPSVGDLILNQSGGLAQHVRRLTEYFKHSEILQNSDGQLSFHPSAKVADFNCSLDILIKWEYSQLKSDFREVVRIAACIGQSFSLEEIAACQMGPFKMGSNIKSNVMTNMKTLCYYFEVSDSYDWFEALPIDDPARDRASPFYYQMRFKDRMVSKNVYHYVKETERLKVNTALLQFYEENLTDTTETWYIPRICQQYSKLTNINRRNNMMFIKNMNMLATYLCVRAECFLEARKLFQDMQNVVERNDLFDDIGARIISEWHLRLAHSYSRCLLVGENNPDECLEHLIEAFKALKFQWPVREADWNRIIWKEGFKWAMRHANIFFSSKWNKLQKASSRKFRSWYEYERNMSLDRLERLMPMLQYMSRYIFDVDGRIRDQIVYDLVCSNVAAQLGEDKSNYRIISGLSIRLWFSGHKKIAKSLIKRIPDVYSYYHLRETDPQTIVLITRFLLAAGSWDSALHWAQHGLDLSYKTGTLFYSR